MHADDPRAVLDLLPRRAVDVPAALDGALREARERGLIRSTFSPDGEEYLSPVAAATDVPTGPVGTKKPP
jgi:hypothetical protein